mmetsp:Transcript_17136/g.15111  ORF Transcript_17136/g.15111 Transcript_17136/m.15111 type:complete len:258 (+) Transcript_17136:295-1068(+)
MSEQVILKRQQNKGFNFKNLTSRLGRISRRSIQSERKRTLKIKDTRKSFRFYINSKKNSNLFGKSQLTNQIIQSHCKNNQSHSLKVSMNNFKIPTQGLIGTMTTTTQFQPEIKTARAQNITNFSNAFPINLPLTRRLSQFRDQEEGNLPEHLKNFMKYQKFKAMGREKFRNSISKPTGSPLALKKFFNHNLNTQNVIDNNLYCGGFKGSKVYNKPRHRAKTQRNYEQMALLKHSLKNFNLKDLRNTRFSNATKTISK